MHPCLFPLFTLTVFLTVSKYFWFYVFSLWSCLLSFYFCPPLFFYFLLSFTITVRLSGPPAPCVLYLGRWPGVGLLLRDLGRKRLRSQPASTGGEPLQCASEDSQVDPGPAQTSLAPPGSSLFSFHFSFLFFGFFSFFSWLSLSLLMPLCHWKPGWYKNKLLHAVECWVHAV